MVFDSSAGADRYTPTPNLNMSAAPMYTVNVPAYSSTNAWPYAYAYNGLPDRLVTQVRYIPTVGATPILLPLRNLRSISVYRPVGGSYDNIMIADDDGVFDGPFADMVAGADYNGYIDTTAGGFSYTAVDYQTMIDSVSTSNGAAYPDTVFIPSSAQHLDNGDYLITNGAAVGDARPWDATAGANNSAQSGGCVFEISATKNLLSFLFGRRIPTAAVAGASVPTGPTNSAPLSQPAFAYRSQ
jgi:hypothetical protein